MIDYIILLIFIGIFVGILSGLLGIGGGFLMVPLQYFLLMSNGIDHDLALRISLGTSLAIIIPTSLSGAYNHNRKLKGILKIGIFLGIFGIIGGLLGGITSSYISSDILSIILGIFLILITISMFFKKKGKNSESSDYNGDNENNSNNINTNNFLDENVSMDNINTNNFLDENVSMDNINNEFSKIIIIFLGLVVGFSSGLLGIGGGIFVIPALSFLGFSMRKSIGISSIFISLTAIGGTLSYIGTGLGANTFPYSLGYVSLINFGIIAIFSIPMAYLGAKLAYKISENKLNYIFIILMIYMGVKMLGFDPITFLLNL